MENKRFFAYGCSFTQYLEIWNSDYKGWTYRWPDQIKAKKEKRL